MVEPLVDPTQLKDSYAEFWARAQDFELTPEETAQATQISQPKKHTLEAVALGVTAGFLLYRAYMKRNLKREMKGKNPSTLQHIMNITWQMFLPSWSRIIVPNLVVGYYLGVREAKSGFISDEYLQAIAQNYAKKLGDELHTTSTEAVMEGFTAQVNRKIPAARALETVLSAYGVPPRAMHTIVTAALTEDPKHLSTLPMDSVRDLKVMHLVDKELTRRAKLAGENEAWSAQSQGKQLAWMFAAKKGLIPTGSKRVWKTVHGERVCKTCGPMHNSKASIDAPFTTASGDLWSPPAHVSCRCDVELEGGGSRVSKAFGDDPYDRDKEGHFSRKEERTGEPKRQPSQPRQGQRRPYADPRPTDPELLRLFNEARERYGIVDAAEMTRREAEKIKPEEAPPTRQRQAGRRQAGVPARRKAGARQAGARQAQRRGGARQAGKPARQARPLSARQVARRQIARRQIERDFAQVERNLPRQAKRPVSLPPQRPDEPATVWEPLPKPLYGIFKQHEVRGQVLRTDFDTPLYYHKPGNSYQGIVFQLETYWEDEKQDIVEAMAGPDYRDFTDSTDDEEFHQNEQAPAATFQLPLPEAGKVETFDITREELESVLESGIYMAQPNEDYDMNLVARSGYENSFSRGELLQYITAPSGRTLEEELDYRKPVIVGITHFFPETFTPHENRLTGPDAEQQGMWSLSSRGPEGVKIPFTFPAEFTWGWPVDLDEPTRRLYTREPGSNDMS